MHVLHPDLCALYGYISASTDGIIARNQTNLLKSDRDVSHPPNYLKLPVVLPDLAATSFIIHINILPPLIQYAQPLGNPYHHKKLITYSTGSEWLDKLEDAGFEGGVIAELESFLHTRGRTFGEAAEALTFLDVTGPTGDGDPNASDDDQNGNVTDGNVTDGIVNTLDANRINDIFDNDDLIANLKSIDKDYQDNVISKGAVADPNAERDYTSG